MLIYQLLLRNSLQNASKLPRQSSSDASSSSSSDSLSSSKVTKTARQKGIPPARSSTSKSASISPYQYQSPTTFAPVQVLNTSIAPLTPKATSKKSSILPYHLSTNITRKPHSSIQNLSSPSSGSSSQTLLSQAKKLLVCKVIPSSLNSHQPLTSPNNDLESVLYSLGEDEDHSPSHSINPQLVVEQKALIAQVQDFQEGVRTRMKQKYSRNHKVVIFQTEDIVTLQILKEDRAFTDNYRVVVIIKSILHEGRHKIQIRFGVLDRLYPTGELNVISSVDQKSYRSSFVGVSTKSISLHAVAAKIGTSNKVAVHCSCKKICTPQSRCKCRKRRIQCFQYCHNSRLDCGNAGPLQEGTKAVVLSRSEDDSEIDSIIGERESSKTRLCKNQKSLVR